MDETIGANENDAVNSRPVARGTNEEGLSKAGSHSCYLDPLSPGLQFFYFSFAVFPYLSSLSFLLLLGFRRNTTIRMKKVITLYMTLFFCWLIKIFFTFLRWDVKHSL